MTKSQAIKHHCMRCSGDSPKEVTLCHIVDCHLWPYRFGFSINDKRFKKRMASARREYPAEFGEMLELVSEYLSDMPNSPEKEQIRTFFKENSGSEEETIGEKRSPPK